MEKILICGAGGFIGTHLAIDLKNKGHHVIGVDLKKPEFSETAADEFFVCDLRDQKTVKDLVTPDITTVYQLAADMGGAGYIFVGDNDADIMHNSATINLNILNSMTAAKVKNVFFTSSACVYPARNQLNPTDPKLDEDSSYPADPDSEYGWEKLFSERLYRSFARNHGLRVRIARLHNVFGPLCTWNNHRAKSPAALCRKVAESDGTIQVWGPGTQTRSFLYIDECIKGISRIQESEYDQPLNLGSERMITINDLVGLIAEIAGKEIVIENIPGPVGVMGRRSDNNLIAKTLGWVPQDDLERGLQETYDWISQMISREKN